MLRSGVASVRRTGTHYDGGFTSAGIFVYAVGTLTWVDGASVDEPDATWISSFEGSSHGDHAGWYSPVLKLWRARPRRNRYMGAL